MAYDEALAGRIRDLVGDEPDLTEQKMFGGLAFLIGGNMAVAASGQGGVLVRVDPDESDDLVATTPAELMEMRGRSMRGWLRVAPEDVSSEKRARRVGRAGHRLRALAAAEVARLMLQRAATPGRLPADGGLELRGDAQEQVVAAVRADELDAHRDAGRRSATAGG